MIVRAVSNETISHLAVFVLMLQLDVHVSMLFLAGLGFFRVMVSLLL